MSLLDPLLQPLSGGCVLLLMLGWPLTVLMLAPVTAVIALLADVLLARMLATFTDRLYLRRD